MSHTLIEYLKDAYCTPYLFALLANHFEYLTEEIEKPKTPF